MMRICKVGLCVSFATFAFMASFADTEVVGGYTWTYRINGDTVEIYGTGYPSYTLCIAPSPTGAVTIPSTLGGKPVTSIGSHAFYTCTNLVSVTIPSSVTSIGVYAFSGCSGLTGVTIPNSVTNIGTSAFSGCSSLMSVTIPNSVTSIGYYVFEGCSGLTSVTIPSSVTNIANYAFGYCGGLTNITVGIDNSTYKSVAGLLLSKDGKVLIRSVNGEVTIPNSVTNIGPHAFSGCRGLTSVTIPGSVTSIGSYAFFGCSGLTSVTIPNSVTSIGSNAFRGCSGLTNVTIPNSVTNIDAYAFYKCSGLTSVTIPDGVTRIENYVFYDCSGLKSLTLPRRVTIIGQNAFHGCSGLTDVTIPDGLTDIGGWTFEGCSGLAGVTIPDGVWDIGIETFKDCTGLKSVTIPDSVERVGPGVFFNCTNLTSMTIPASVRSIEYEAFSGCRGLTNITFAGNAPSVGNNVFNGVASGCCAYVRRDSTGWGVEIPGTWNGIAIDRYDPPAPAVTDVTAKQRYPWNGLVDITCKVTGINGTTNLLDFAVSAVMPDTGETRGVSRFWVMQDGARSTDREVHTNGNYRLLWDAQADLGQVTYDNMVVRVTTVKGHDKVQLWEGGPYWADTNIGAENPEDYGYYFWWGDTVGYKRENNKWVATDGSSSNFSFSSGNAPTYNKSIATLKSEGWITEDSVLVPAHDAAHVHWGGNWRMPTEQELSDLNNKCDWTWATQNGVKGYVVKGKGTYASASIFLPCAGVGYGTSLNNAGSNGIYWSSVPCSGSYNARYLGFGSGDHDTGISNRYGGQSVRPLQGFTN